MSIYAKMLAALPRSSFGWSQHQKSNFAKMLVKLQHPSSDWSSRWKSSFSKMLAKLRHPSFGWSFCQTSMFAKMLVKRRDLSSGVSTRPQVAKSCFSMPVKFGCLSPDEISTIQQASQGQAVQILWQSHALQGLVEATPKRQKKCKPLGIVTPSKLWLKLLPKVRVRKLWGKVMPPKRLLKLSPNDKTCKPFGKSTSTSLWLKR